MTAWQRSNITQRQEKGLGSISLRRLILAGGTAAMVAVLGSRGLGFVPACSSALVALVGTLAITHPVEGLPLVRLAARSLRGLATLAAIHNREGPLRVAGQVMQVSPDEGILLADDVYGAVWEDQTDRVLPGEEWVYLGRFGDVEGEGLAFVANPFGPDGALAGARGRREG